MLYLAYGSNLNLSQMSNRCPKAVPIGWMMLHDYKLVFRGVADIIHDVGPSVPVGIWNISKDCEKALDKYEGAPKLYRKSYIDITFDENTQTALFYQMNHREISGPSEYYLNVIMEGYDDFEIDYAPLYEALNYSTNYSDEPLPF